MRHTITGVCLRARSASTNRGAANASMNPFLSAYRRAARHLDVLRGHLELNVTSNRVERRTDFASCDRPVLLLYGFFSTRRTLDVLERRLRRDGYGVFSLDLGGFARSFNTRGIDDLADFVRAKIERLYARYPNLGPLTVVGHSKGGLIATYYVKRLGGARRVRAVVTLGTPHNGTPVAYTGIPIGLLARSVLQMTPRSPFIRRLQRGAWPAGVRLTSIWSRSDLLAPFPTALLDTQGAAHVRNVEVACKHGEFLFKKHVYEAVLCEIRASEEALPRRQLTLVPGAG